MGNERTDRTNNCVICESDKGYWNINSTWKSLLGVGLDYEVIKSWVRDGRKICRVCSKALAGFCMRIKKPTNDNRVLTVGEVVSLTWGPKRLRVIKEVREYAFKRPFRLYRTRPLGGKAKEDRWHDLESLSRPTPGEILDLKGEDLLLVFDPKKNADHYYPLIRSWAPQAHSTAALIQEVQDAEDLLYHVYWPNKVISASNIRARYEYSCIPPLESGWKTNIRQTGKLKHIFTDIFPAMRIHGIHWATLHPMIVGRKGNKTRELFIAPLENEILNDLQYIKEMEPYWKPEKLREVKSIVREKVERYMIKLGELYNYADKIQPHPDIMKAFRLKWTNKRIRTMIKTVGQLKAEAETWERLPD